MKKKISGGEVFQIKLSASSLPAETDDAADLVSPKGGDKGKTVLIIEDDKFLRDLIVQKLVREGFAVTEALDGEEGFKKIKEEKPQVALLDLILPGIDGFGVLERIGQETQTILTKIIVLSNLGQKEDIDRALKLGAADYLIKAHFTPTEIVKRIREVLAR